MPEIEVVVESSERNARFRWVARSVVASTAVLVLWFGIEHGGSGLLALGGAAGAVFLSKLSIFGGVVEGNLFGPWSLALIAWIIDLLVALTLLAWIGRVEQMPIAGPALRRARVNARATLATYPGLARMAFGGVLVFVFLPLPGSGAIGGTLIARLVGLSRVSSFLAVAIGSCLAVAAYAVLAYTLGARWRSLVDSPWIGLASIAGLALFCWIAFRYVQRVMREA